MRLACLLSLLLTPLLVNSSPVVRGGPEVEIELRYHPDKTGQRTTNRAIKAQGREAEISEDGDEREVDITQAEFDRLVDMVKSRVAEFPWGEEEGGRLKAPYVEILFKYETGNREIEVEHHVPAGSVPADCVELQEAYFDGAYR